MPAAMEPRGSRFRPALAWGVLALIAVAGIVIGCQGKSGSGDNAGANAADHPTRRAADADHPTGKASAPQPARKDEHPSSPAGKSDHPTSKVSNPKLASPAKPVAPNEVCLFPPDADPNAITKIQKGQKLAAFSLTDIRNGRMVGSADAKDKYLLVHYWVSW